MFVNKWRDPSCNNIKSLTFLISDVKDIKSQRNDLFLMKKYVPVDY